MTVAPSDFLDLDALPLSGEPTCTFKLDGRTWHVRSKDDLSWGVLSTQSISDETDDQGKVTVQVEDFFRQVIVPDEVEDFCALLHSRSSRLTIAKVQPLIQFVSEKVYGRPTKRAEPSTSGRKRTTASLKADSSSRATPRVRSAS